MFKVGRYYRHKSGDLLFIAGSAKTMMWGYCLVGENKHGELKPIGQNEDNFQNWKEISEDDYDMYRRQIRSITTPWS